MYYSFITTGLSGCKKEDFCGAPMGTPWPITYRSTSDKKAFTANIIVVIVVFIETYFAGEDKYSPTPNIIVVIVVTIETYFAGEDK